MQVYHHLSTTPYTTFTDQNSDSFRHNHQRHCLLTLVHSECKRAAGDRTLSSLCAAEHRSGISGWSGCLFSCSGRGRPLKWPCLFMLFTIDRGVFSELHSKLLPVHYLLIKNDSCVKIKTSGVHIMNAVFLHCKKGKLWYSQSFWWMTGCVFMQNGFGI